jgi:hypothetical protein
VSADPWQHGIENTSLSGLGLHANSASLRLNDLLDERKPETRTLVLLFGSEVDLVEDLEEPLLFLGPDTDAGVLHREAEGLVALGLEQQGDPPAGRCELDRVREVVQ